MAFHKIVNGIEEIFILVIQDQNGREKEKWTCLKRDFHKVVRILNQKYGLGIYKLKEEKKEKDLDWALN